jgi:hypothetical protein
MLLTACGSAGGILGSIGSILGSPSAEQPSDVRGSVTAINTSARRIDMSVATVNNLRSTGNQQSGSIYYDDNTKVTYNGTAYMVTDLERGDEIEVRGVNDNGRYLAQQITVTRDATN